MNAFRLVVVGAGISGMTAALMARRAGADVTVATFGFGGMQLSQGTIDVLDVPRPLDGMAALPATHPYHTITADSIREGAKALAEYVPLRGTVEESTTFPTALGSLRRTALYPESMAAGAVRKGDGDRHYVIVGISGLKDFYPRLVAENLCGLNIQARAAAVELAAPGDTALAYSRTLKEPGAAEGLGRKLAEIAESGEYVGIPAVVREAEWKRIQSACPNPVFQIPLPPPSIPGLEMNERLREACSQQRIRMFLNSKAVGLVAEGSRVTAVKVAVAGATKEVPADYVIYAAGGLDSGAIELDSHRELHDTVFGLPVAHENELLHGDFWGEPQPLYAAGLNVDEQMRPTGEKGPVYTNLYAVGDMLAGAYRAREKSGEGIAIGSAAQAVASIMRSEA